mmetsp:Transcript_100899/g.195126  ORF Transcript_100899/g.195126 Transcript_100899/m.195126 type:complete len:95 (+) Transcript_100899:1242-1526(+)
MRLQHHLQVLILLPKLLAAPLELAPLGQAPPWPLPEPLVPPALSAQPRRRPQRHGLLRLRRAAKWAATHFQEPMRQKRAFMVSGEAKLTQPVLP